LSGVRRDATVHRVVDLLVEQPVLSAPVVADRLGVSVAAAHTALSQLAALGVVEPYEPRRSGRGRPTLYWVADQLVQLVAAPGG
jgi:predicted ArsR family transcriptional regulator